MKTIGTMTITISLAIWDAYLLTFFWLWFIVPFGLIELSISHAYGLMLLRSIVTVRVNMKEETDLLEVLLSAVFKSVVITIISFPLGYIVHQIMIGQ